MFSRTHVVEWLTGSNCPVAVSVVLGGGGSLLQQTGVRLAVLPSCKSQWAGEAFVDAGVPHVICINVMEEVQDVAVLRFTRALYTSLAAGQSVSSAFNIAKQSVASQPDILVRCRHCSPASVGAVGAYFTQLITPESRGCFSFFARAMTMLSMRVCHLVDSFATLGVSLPLILRCVCTEPGTRVGKVLAATRGSEPL